MPIHVQPTEDPFEALTHQMDQVLNELVHRQFHGFSQRDCWEPAINVYETPDAYFVCVDLAGMERHQIDVREDGGRLAISGHRTTPHPPDTVGPLSVERMEIDSGLFRRAVEIPDDVDRTAIRARYREGLLWLTLPRKRCIDPASGG